MAEQWYNSRENLSALLRFLTSRDECEWNEEWICYFLSKPWKWEREWHEFLLSRPEWKA